MRAVEFFCFFFFFSRARTTLIVEIDQRTVEKSRVAFTINFSSKTVVRRTCDRYTHLPPTRASRITYAKPVTFARVGVGWRAR